MEDLGIVGQRARLNRVRSPTAIGNAGYQAEGH